MIDNAILGSLVFNEPYLRKVLPFLERQYFEQVSEQITFTLIKNHFNKYGQPPTIDSLLIDLSNKSIEEHAFEQTRQLISQLKPSDADLQWLIDHTERFCKTRALYRAIEYGAELLVDRKDSKYGEISAKVEKALAITFDDSLGHDYLEDAEARWEKNTSNQSLLKCDLDIFNQVTRGGFVEQSLTIFLAPTGVGKSLFLGHFAAQFLEAGANVLYISLEMPSEQVGKRIDAHLLDISMEELKTVDRSKFLQSILEIKKKTIGKIIIQEYPAHTAHSGHFRHLISELKNKKQFDPDIIIIDYLGICGCASVSRSVGMYEYLKTLTEEVRSLGQEFNARVFTAAQVNREGSKSTDFEIYDTAESWGIPHTADYIYGIVSTPEMEQMQQLMIKRLKDRHNDPFPTKFVIGVDRSKMRLFDIEQPDHQQQTKQSKFDKLIV